MVPLEVTSERNVSFMNRNCIVNNFSALSFYPFIYSNKLDPLDAEFNKM